MKLVVVLSVILLGSSSAFCPLAAPKQLTKLQMGYVPDGMSPEQWRKMKDKEKQNKESKKFGAFGPQTFKSRSLQSFQKDLEKGKTGHLMPMFNAKEKLKKGQIKQEDIPYMQRGGAWDNSDVKGAKKKAWRSADKKYNANAKPFGVDWTGGNQRKGPSQPGATNKQTPPKKKTFGFF
mmetsp:Transcript_24741/g.42102  ORF Transcript_24741/g.42102 Transcript_24741/m.42102 type:complete len:178 (-) Transcript_24741:521-1054(-)